MEVEPPVPVVPADALTASPRARRRRSLPSATDGPSKKRSPNHVRPQPASPEVISSLIDSLSAISLPAHTHFENFPSVHGGSVSTPASPFQTHFNGDPLAYNGATGIDPAANRHPRDNDLLYPDDAAEPPVVRTSKPPSGLSPLTAPKPAKKEKEHSLKNYMRAGCESTTSLQSVKSIRSVSSIGNISIEAGIPRHSTASRTSSDSKRSARGTRGLMYMSSREKLKGKDTDRKRQSAPLSINASGSYGSDLLSAPKAGIMPPSPKHIPTEEPIDEEPVVAESSRSAERYNQRGASPLRHGVASRSSDEHDSPTRRGLIPERQSSLRHHESPSRKGKRGHTRRGKSHDSSKTKTVLEEDEVEMNPEDKILKELEAEENEVARRIKELKERKQMREKSAGKMPVGMAAGDSRSVSRVSPITSPPLSPASTVSSVSEIRAQDQKAAKAHKVLGISSSPIPPPRRTSRIPNLAEQRELLKQLGEQSDAEENTPLPINYQLALQALERPSSPPASATSSSKGSKPNSVGTPVRSKSVAVGGRSAASRKKTHSMIMGAATQPRVTSSEFPPLSTTSSQSTSEDYFSTVGSRHLSLNLSPSSAPTNGSKKKRWSHPDIPLKAEQMHNAEVERGAVKPPPRPVIEERPSSVDSVDLAVEAYLDSPRLSQKVRHPQTGRVICFSEVGDPRGFAVFCCVGMGLTRYVMSFYDELALTLKLRLITADRPGVGESQSDSNGTPLSWPDDVLVICQALGITKFSLLAHSAGAVYALAAALRMPQQIRGRVHLLAPWIPPSQMAPIGVHQDAPPGGQLPKSQRFLRTLPPSLLKIANSSFLSTTSASITRNVPKTPNKKTRKSTHAPVQQAPVKDTRRESIMLMDQVLPTGSALSLAANNPTDPHHETAVHMKKVLSIAERERRNAFDERLTFAIWDRATSNANPATDLMVCLETRQTIGFRYEDITRGVVIHHGSKDSRVPVDNVRWLSRLMRRCEVRIIDGEQHGLMASAVVMGNVLTEVAKEWEDWTAVVQAGGKNADKRGSH
ncbi:alpha/beta-hydrolase [Mytilinidion resinicola]|uniref:Alpha/beta-hydrolase n=1 Tax=Mytilinidion resinicola TaxID=574789 RepID=A0A6A6Z6Y9_9PEZI|nr:alpha/beta-hydrolase [Mytilinidion resinicola]KAF2816433.1 alpha/beta-hydrolase [Mytilinidion resinicola]